MFFLSNVPTYAVLVLLDTAVGQLVQEQALVLLAAVVGKLVHVHLTAAVGQLVQNYVKFFLILLFSSWYRILF